MTHPVTTHPADVENVTRTRRGDLTSRIKVQLLPKATANPKAFAKQRVCPTRKSVTDNYLPEHRDEIAKAMVDSLVYSYALMSNVTAPVRHLGDFTARMLAQQLGRCLWTWEDVPALDGIETAQFTQAMGPIALRPTSLFPDDMQVVSPRLSCNLLQASNRAIERVIQRFVASGRDGASLPKYSLGTALCLTTYGEYQDKRLPAFYRLPERIKRSGYSARQSLILDLAAPEGVLPFTISIVRETLYEEDLARRLKEVRGEVEKRLRTLAERLPEGEIKDALVEGEIPYQAACDRVVKQRWDFPIGPMVDGYPDGDPDDDIMSLTCRAVVVVVSAEGRLPYLPTAVLFALSILTGVSPAAYVRFAIGDLDRRGVTYMTVQQVEELRGIVLEYIDGWEGRDRGRAEVLIKELSLLEREFDRATLRNEMRSERVGAWFRERGVGFAEEWFGGVDLED